MTYRTDTSLLPHFLAAVFLAIAVWSGIAPAERAVWYAEIVPAAGIFLILAATFRRFRFSNTAYLLMGAWLMLHTVGAHYTFAAVPFEQGSRLLAPLLGEGRNHFDRVAHFSIGLYAFAVAEWLLRRKKCTFGTALFTALCSIMALATAYEIVEWQYAVLEGGQTGIEFLGSQGDIWDAQKDMLADTLGALAALLLFVFVRPDRRA